jgi:hypothetical protein
MVDHTMHLMERLTWTQVFGDIHDYCCINYSVAELHEETEIRPRLEKGRYQS